MGQPHEDYQKELPKFVRISAELFEKPVASATKYLTDATMLTAVANEYRNQLEEEGLDVTIIDFLIPRANAYAVAVSNHDMMISDIPAKRELYASKKEGSFELRRELFRFGDAAFENLAGPREQLKVIKKGTGPHDLVADLLDIPTLFNQHLTAFTPYKRFDKSMLDQSLALHRDLKELYAAINCPKEKLDELTLREKQAFVHLITATREVRKWAKLAFATQPDILERFNVTYIHNGSKKRSSTAVTETTESSIGI